MDYHRGRPFGNDGAAARRLLTGRGRPPPPIFAAELTRHALHEQETALTQKAAPIQSHSTAARHTVHPVEACSGFRNCCRCSGSAPRCRGQDSRTDFLSLPIMRDETEKRWLRRRFIAALTKQPGFFTYGFGPPKAKDHLPRTNEGRPLSMREVRNAHSGHFIAERPRMPEGLSS